MGDENEKGNNGGRINILEKDQFLERAKRWDKQKGKPGDERKHTPLIYNWPKIFATRSLQILWI